MAVIAEKNILFLSKESAYGIFLETSAVCVPVENMSPKPDPGLVSRDTEKVGSLFQPPALTTKEGYPVGFKGNVYPGDEIGLILWQLFGAAVTSGATADKTHLFAIDEAKLAVKSLSCELSEGGMTADDYAGLMLGAFKLNFSNDGLVKFEVEGRAQSKVDGTLPGSISYSALRPFCFADVTLKIDGTAVSVESGALSFDPAVLLENYKAGSAKIFQPVLNGRPAVTLQISKAVADRTYRAMFLAGTTGKKIELILTHPSVIGATATHYKLNFEMPAAQVSEYSVSGDAGEMKESITFKGYVGTGTGANVTSLETTLVNASTAYA